MVERIAFSWSCPPGKLNMKKNLICLWVFLLTLACAHKQAPLDATRQSDTEIYQIGLKHMEAKDYEKAREAFKVVFDNFPKSENRILAKIEYADSYFFEGTDASFLLAIQEYQDFISLFPFSPKAEYAQFQIGVCYFHMTEKSDRDQTNTHKSVEEFRKVLDNYQNGQYFQQATDRLVVCYGKLADHEFQIARYYLHTSRYLAAVDRIKAMFQTYPESVQKAEHYMVIAEALEKGKQEAESCAYYDKVVQKWPQSEQVKDAKEGMQRVCRELATATP